jgi:putative Ca2+/H+ antiporter (TMEM165/GDT1 family)
VLALADTFPVDSLLAVIASTFVVIFVAELPDKTALAALALATRYRTADVIAGAWSALAVQTVIAVTVGGLISALPSRPIHVAAGVSFLVFAGLAWRRDEAAQAAEERAGIRAAQASRRGAVMTCFIVVLAAEFGDLTQLATAALAAHTASPLGVGVGALAALWTVSTLAALAGRHAAGFASGRTLSRASALLFGIVGLVLLLTTLTGG